MFYLHTPLGKNGRWPAVTTTGNPASNARRRRPIVTTDVPERMAKPAKNNEMQVFMDA